MVAVARKHGAVPQGSGKAPLTGEEMKHAAFIVKASRRSSLAAADVVGTAGGARSSSAAAAVPLPRAWFHRIKSRRNPQARSGPDARPSIPAVAVRLPIVSIGKRDHRLRHCPHCAGHGRSVVWKPVRSRTEDIPEGITPVVTEHTIHRDWCPQCRKMFEPVVPDALPHSTLGNRTLAMTSWLHYGLGNTLSQIVEVFNFHFQMKLTPGGLVQMWQRLQAVLYPWYEQLQAEALASAVLHADETSWRVSGKTRWLWCFANDTLTYYLTSIAPGANRPCPEVFCRGVPGHAGQRLLGPSTTRAPSCGKRGKAAWCICCGTWKRSNVTGAAAKTGRDLPRNLRRLLGDAIRLWRRKAETPPESYASRRGLFSQRLEELIETDWGDSQAQRLIKRLRRHRGDLFTFLDRDGVPFDNNLPVYAGPASRNHPQEQLLQPEPTRRPIHRPS